MNTSHAAPARITMDTFTRTRGVVGFRREAAAAGGRFVARNDAGYLFAGSGDAAAAVSVLGFNVTVWEGPGEGDRNAAYFLRTGEAVTWLAARPVGLEVV